MKSFLRMFFFTRTLIAANIFLTSLQLSGATEGKNDFLVNYERTFACPIAEVVAPETYEEVQTIVRRAIKYGRKIKAATHKFNSQVDAACASEDGIQITTEKLNRILKIDREKQLATAQSGVRLGELNDALKKQQLSINMVAEGGFFSIGGLLGSDTHGSTMTQGVSLSEYITEIKLVDGLGQLRTMTGQDLLAARVNLGVLGVVVEATFKVEPLKKVRADLVNGNDANLETIIMELPRKNYSVSLAWFPGTKAYAATIYNFVDNTTPGEGVNKQAEMPDWAFSAFKKFFSLTNVSDSELGQCTLENIRKHLRSKSYFQDKGKVMSAPIGWSDDMQYFKCNKKGTCPWDIIPIVVHGYSIPLAQLPQWISDVRKIVDAHSDKGRVCFPLNGIYFRFGRSTDAWLAMNEGRDTVFIDMEYVVNTNDSYDDGKKITLTKWPMYNQVYQEIGQMTLQKYNARPHWGKNLAAEFEAIGPKQYPHWQKFVDYKKTIDPENIFTNPWWERMNQRDLTAKELKPACAFDGSCFCQTNDHCLSGSKCVAGRVWTPARICVK